VVPGLVLLKFPAVSLFRVMVMATAGPAVARTGESALFPGHGVLVFAAAGVAPAGRPAAVPVADLDEMAEFVAGVVSAGLVLVVTVVDRNGLKIDGQLRPACSARFAEAGPSQP
jgi:hypothetical protein